MKLGTLLLVVGVCVAALGSAGFDTPYEALERSTEPYAIPLFAVGLALLFGGGLMSRKGQRAGSADGSGGEVAAYQSEIRAIRDRVAELEERQQELSDEALRDGLGTLLSEEYFDLTQKSDAFARLIGFSEYARVWEGVATAERLLARCWSMCADGFGEQGKEELPLARASLDQALAALAD